MSSRIEMNCSKANLAIYNEFEEFRFKSSEYRIVSNDNGDIGIDDFLFKIEFLNNKEIVKGFKNSSISFCENGKAYIGRSLKGYTSLPPACHFYFNYTENGYLKLDDQKRLICFSTKFLTSEEYARDILGVK